MKTVLFVPGFREGMKSRDYASTIHAIEAQGYKVKFIPINWLRTTIDDWVQELETAYSKYDPQDTILAGFSYGAMTCFIAATGRNPSELWLFSLSPYFAEDIKSKNMKQSWLKNIGHRRVTAFRNLKFKDLAKSIKCKTLLFVGEIEADKWQILKKRTLTAHDLLENSVQMIVPSVGHDVTDPNYIAAIKAAI